MRPKKSVCEGLVEICEGEGALDGTKSIKNAASGIQRGARSTCFRKQAEDSLAVVSLDLTPGDSSPFVSKENASVG